jgi:uncharacterized protein (DUF1800 family)
MAYLDQNQTVLTVQTAGHLLRRVTAGVSKADIQAFVGKTPLEAYNTLLANNETTLPEPTVLNSSFPNYQQTYVNTPFNGDNNFELAEYIKYWWVAEMIQPINGPNLLDKLSVFWQNHFVTTREIVGEYRYIWRYINLIRNNSLGNFKDFVIAITKDPAMLVYLNGNENVKGAPNENYARELQELFVVGEKNFAGQANYAETDVKEAAKVLTGWYYRNYWWTGTTEIEPGFDPNKHETGNKTFSSFYNNTQIAGRSGANAGNDELNDLVNMLLAHNETAKFIVRKLYKWYVNPIVTATIETNVIIPLANIFKSPANNWAIEPVLKILLTSDVFYDVTNIGAIIKSPLELAAGMLRYYEQPVPNRNTEPQAYKKYFEFLMWQMYSMQMSPIDQLSVFGYEPYYQTNLSKAWIASSTIALRNSFTDAFIWKWPEVSPTYTIGIDFVARITAIQPNMNNPVRPFSPGTSTAVSAEQVLEHFTENLLVNPFTTEQKNFLIDTIMLEGRPRASWKGEWDDYRESKRLVETTPQPIPTELETKHRDNYNTVRWRMQLLMRYALKMAEHHVF